MKKEFTYHYKPGLLLQVKENRIGELHVVIVEIDEEPTFDDLKEDEWVVVRFNGGISSPELQQIYKINEMEDGVIEFRDIDEYYHDYDVAIFKIIASSDHKYSGLTIDKYFRQTNLGIFPHEVTTNQGVMVKIELSKHVPIEEGELVIDVNQDNEISFCVFTEYFMPEQVVEVVMEVLASADRDDLTERDILFIANRILQ